MVLILTRHTEKTAELVSEFAALGLTQCSTWADIPRKNWRDRLRQLAAASQLVIFIDDGTGSVIPDNWVEDLSANELTILLLAVRKLPLTISTHRPMSVYAHIMVQNHGLRDVV